MVFEKWFKYINYVNQRSVEEGRFGIDVSHKGFRFIGVDFKAIEECVRNSFVEPGNIMSDNKILREDRRWQFVMGVNTHPSITINNQSYYGDFNGRDIARALCASFNVQKPECQQG